MLKKIFNNFLNKSIKEIKDFKDEAKEHLFNIEKEDITNISKKDLINKFNDLKKDFNNVNDEKELIKKLIIEKLKNIDTEKEKLFYLKFNEILLEIDSEINSDFLFDFITINNETKYFSIVEKLFNTQDQFILKKIYVTNEFNLLNDINLLTENKLIELKKNIKLSKVHKLTLEETLLYFNTIINKYENENINDINENFKLSLIEIAKKNYYWFYFDILYKFVNGEDLAMILDEYPIFINIYNEYLMSISNIDNAKDIYVYKERIIDEIEKKNLKLFI